MMAADSMYRCCTDDGRKCVEMWNCSALAVLEEGYHGVNPQLRYQLVSFQSDKWNKQRVECDSHRS